MHNTLYSENKRVGSIDDDDDDDDEHHRRKLQTQWKKMHDIATTCIAMAELIYGRQSA
mgnify:CR=1 FL=1